ncbi:MAG: HTTM domain-containing protein [bacterium]|nr:HTTM domain-containing protein [bacterium]
MQAIVTPTAAIPRPKHFPALARLEALLFAPVEVLPLVYLRVIFGAVMMWEVWRYFHHGWIRRYYIDTVFTFKYYGFEWVQPLPGAGMYAWFIGLGVLAFCILIGFAYRPAVILFFFGFSFVFLLDQANYLNHFYLVCILAFILIFLPANRAFALDSWLRPKLRAETAPRWTLRLLQFQLLLVYVYAGVAKLNVDWLRGEPMRMWLAERTATPLIGQWFTEEWMVYLFSYGGLMIDLLAAPALLWKRTRWPALIALISFHLLNGQLFNIGIFPWLMLAMLPLLLPTEWLAQPLRRLRLQSGYAPTKPHAMFQPRRLITAALIAFAAFQLLFPLRHWLYPGDVAWTEEGHRFSWRMKLRDKASDARFFVYSGADWWEIDLRQHLSARQIDEMSTRPDMILQFAHYLRDAMHQQGYQNVRVTAWVVASLNGREARLLIDPNADLAAATRPLFGSADWIMPLDSPQGVVAQVRN